MGGGSSCGGGDGNVEAGVWRRGRRAPLQSHVALRSYFFPPPSDHLSLPHRRLALSYFLTFDPSWFLSLLCDSRRCDVCES